MKRLFRNSQFKVDDLVELQYDSLNKGGPYILAGAIGRVVGVVEPPNDHCLMVAFGGSTRMLTVLSVERVDMPIYSTDADLLNV